MTWEKVCVKEEEDDDEYAQVSIPLNSPQKKWVYNTHMRASLSANILAFEHDPIMLPIQAQV
jgi:hypothetical protein